MVRVYSWAELRAGHYSSVANLNLARERGIELLHRLHEKGWIESGQLYGSITREDHKTGSDIDALVISKPEHTRRVQRYLSRVINSSVRDFGVYVGIQHISRWEAESGLHGLPTDRFGHIIKAPPEMTVGVPPEQFVKVPVRHPVDDVLERIVARLRDARRFSSYYRTYRQTNSEQYYRYLSQMLSRSLQTARIVLELESDPREPVMHKGDVIRQYRERHHATPAGDAFDHLVKASEGYQEVLASTISAIRSGNRPRIALARKRYSDFLKKLAEVNRHYVAFLEQNLALVHSQYRSANP